MKRSKPKKNARVIRSYTNNSGPLKKTTMPHSERYDELLQYFDEVKPYPSLKHCNGFLVNGQYIVAGQKKRWRAKGHGTWYWYRSMEHLQSFVYDEQRQPDQTEALEDLENRIHDTMYDIDQQFEAMQDQIDHLEAKVEKLKKD